MYTGKDVTTKRKPPQPVPDPTAPEATDWGWRRPFTRGDDYEAFLEHLGAGAHLGKLSAPTGQLTLLVLQGALWVREDGKVARLAAGRHFTSTPGRSFELATGAEGATLVRIQPTGYDGVLERAPGTGNRLPQAARTAPIIAARPEWRTQGSLPDRTARANAAQGLARVLPVPGQARTAAEVAFSTTQPGTNLVPVVPEP